jgi:iron(III) transport system substrate-binding protein
MMRKILFCLFLALGAGTVLGACGSNDSGDGSITVYSGRDEEMVAPLFEQFTEQTGIEVKARYGDSAEMAAAILEEGDNSPATVFFSQDAGALGALESAGRLAGLPAAILDRVPARFRSKAGEWVGISGRARVFAYNRERVDPDELPSTADEMTGPEWEGRLGWVPDNASFQAFVTAMRIVDGDEAARNWLERMVGNGVRAYPGNTELRDAIAAGEVDAGLTNHYYVIRAMDEAGDDFQGRDFPVDIHFTNPDDPGALINVAGAGVLLSAADPDDGERLIEFLLGNPSQEYFATETKEYPLVPGIEVDEALVPLAGLESPDIDLSDLEDLEATLKMIQDSGAL